MGVETVIKISVDGQTGRCEGVNEVDGTVSLSRSFEVDPTFFTFGRGRCGEEGRG